jgi:hypothetical protein
MEEGGGRFAVAMTAQENDRFLRSIKNDHSKYYGMLGRVNAETSDCSRASDRESIHEGIRRSVGFAKLSRMVFGVMEGWMEERLRGQAAARAAAGDDREAMSWKEVLAAILTDQGRHDEGVVMQEAVLNFQRRVLPENHPDIGSTSCFGLLIEVEVDALSPLGTAMGNLVETYSELGRHQDALAMGEQTLEFLRRALPENHPNIGAT